MKKSKKYYVEIEEERDLSCIELQELYTDISDDEEYKVKDYFTVEVRARNAKQAIRKAVRFIEYDFGYHVKCATVDYKEGFIEELWGAGYRTVFQNFKVYKRILNCRRISV